MAALLVLGGSPIRAGLVPGGGPRASDCYTELDVVGIAPRTIVEAISTTILETTTTTGERHGHDDQQGISVVLALP